MFSRNAIVIKSMALVALFKPGEQSLKVLVRGKSFLQEGSHNRGLYL
jgi:hypothetical protein